MPGTSAEFMTLEFWRGSVQAGKCKLPISSIIASNRQARMGRLC